MRGSYRYVNTELLSCQVQAMFDLQLTNVCCLKGMLICVRSWNAKPESRRANVLAPAAMQQVFASCNWCFCTVADFLPTVAARHVLMRTV
jgi:hypothetical protein